MFRERLAPAQGLQRSGLHRDGWMAVDRWRVGRWRGERGAVTAEYAIATIAAVGFAALLVVVLRSDEVRSLLTDLIRHALAMP